MGITLLTGPRGCGKTTACARLVANNPQLTAAGVLAPALYDDEGVKAGIMIRNMATGDERRLATLVPTDSAQVTVGQYAFDDAVASWGLEAILNGLGSLVDVVFVDEIGPLEVRQRAGFWPALECLGTMRAQNAVVIVRLRLVDQLAQRLAHLNPRVITLSLDNRDQVPDALLAALSL